MDDSTPPTSTTHSSEVEALRELALALLEVPTPMGTNDTEPVPQLLVGQLPPNLGIALPMPPESHLLGSLVGAAPRIALVTTLSHEDVLAFYRQQVQALGWRVPEMPGSGRGGFQHSFGISQSFIYFENEEQSRSLHVSVASRANAPTVVRIALQPTGQQGPRQRRARQHRGPDMWSVLPPITPPPHTQQEQQGSSGGSDRVMTSARLETDLDLAALTAHYDAQLQHGGWQLQSSGSNDPVSWSSWTFVDEESEPWQGMLLLVRQVATPRRFLAVLFAEWQGAQTPAARGGGGFSYAPLGWSSSVSSSTAYAPRTPPPTPPSKGDEVSEKQDEPPR